MRKVFLSLLVIFTFMVYSIHLRLDEGDEVGEVAQRPTLAPTDVLPTTQPTSSTPGAAVPTTAPVIPTSTPRPTSKYKDGVYVGDAADAFYGNIQVKITIKNGRIEDVNFLQYPNDRGPSIEINQQADPILAQEAIQAQSAQVDIVSGATDSSQAFIQSMQSALDKAKI